MGALITVFVLITVGLILVLVHFIVLGAVMAGAVVAAIIGVFGKIFDFPDPLVILAVVIAFGVVAYLIDKRRKENIAPNHNLPNRR